MRMESGELIFVATISCLIAYAVSRFFQQKNATKTHFRFLLINDVYKPRKLAQLPSLLQKYKNSEENCKFVVAGDFLGGSTFAAKSQGRSIIDILNALKADYLLLGNHEFDYGSEVTREVVPLATAKWFGSNCRNLDGSLFPCVLDTEIIQVGECSIGMFGIITQRTPYLSMPGDKVKFESYLDHAKRCVDFLQGKCDCIVAFTHVSIEQDKQLATLPIDLILGGHDHTPFHLIEKGTTILKCGQDAELLGVVDLSLSPGASAKIKSVEMISTSEPMQPRDPKIMEIIAKWRSKFSEPGDNEVVCTIKDLPLSSMTSELRSTETNFGTIVADAMRDYIICNNSEALASPEIPLIGIINGGFIRANESYGVGESLTVFDVKEELPFPRFPIMFELTGALLREALEEMLVKLPAKTGAFPHFSVGVKASFQTESPRLLSFKINDVELKPEDLCYVVISDAYYVKACDGVETYRQKGIIRAHCTELLIQQVVAQYLAKLKVVSGILPGRFVNIS